MLARGSHSAAWARRAVITSWSSPTTRHYTLNVVPITKPKTQKEVLGFNDALTFLRCYAIPTPSNRPETLEVQMILNNMDKKGKARQPVRGSVLLPHATGKKKKLLVLTTDEQQAENALAAGADAVGGKDFVDQVMNGELAPNKYDIIIATPEMEKILRPAAKVLRAMLPTTKRGTIVPNVSEAVTRFKNSVQFKADNMGLCHAGVGKLTFTDDALRENVSAFVRAVKESFPLESKGKLITKLHLSSTRGPSVRVNAAEFGV